MNCVPKNAVISSIHIEPVDSEEYNQNLVEQLTLYHKQTFLRHANIEPNLLDKSHTKHWKRLVVELNKHKPKCSYNEWKNIFRAWKESVGKSHANLSKEDQDLSKLIRNHHLKCRDDEISIEDLTSHCRICLASSSSKMLFLYDQNTQTHHFDRDEMTLLDKLNYCSCFTINATIDDDLPQYICMSCSILVENAYQLKVLCRKTEEKLQSIGQKPKGSNTYDTAEESHVSSKIVQTDANPKVTEENVILSECIELDEHVQYVERENEQTESENRHNVILQSTKMLEAKEPHETLDTDDATEEIDTMKSSRVYRCDICTAVFSTKRSVDDHMTKNHKDDAVRKKSHPCPDCGKLFRMKCSLTIHIRTHTGERPYSCEVCGKTFKTSSAANNHRIVHTESKDFQCSSCSFSTNTKANLNLHERTHTGIQPYQCQFCPMKFRTASNVTKHMRNIHEKQKTNKCDKCDRSFFTRESLRKHSISHTGLKPFYCPVHGCSLTYAWYNGLKKHIRHQHSKEHVTIPSEKFFFDKIKHISLC